MTAFDIMREWDREARIEPPRSDADLMADVPGGLGDWDWDEWLAALEADDVDAILEGRQMWGLESIQIRPVDLLTLAQAGQLLGLSLDTLRTYKKRYAGTFPRPWRCGAHGEPALYLYSDIRAWAESTGRMKQVAAPGLEPDLSAYETDQTTRPCQPLRSPRFSPAQRPLAQGQARGRGL
jgi:predicted DNA-binding transcriptional regulator AlpA